MRKFHIWLIAASLSLNAALSWMLMRKPPPRKEPVQQTCPKYFILEDTDEL